MTVEYQYMLEFHAYHAQLQKLCGNHGNKLSIQCTLRCQIKSLCLHLECVVKLLHTYHTRLSTIRSEKENYLWYPWKWRTGSHRNKILS